MANNFASDPNCVALWRLEDGALTTDSIGTNTLTNTGVVADTSNYQEGAASGDFESTENDHMEIADASLSAGFPLKIGDTNKEISVCFWMKPESISASTVAYVVSKADVTHNKASLGITLQTDRTITVFLWYSGALYNTVNLASLALTAGCWYFVAVTYDDTKRLCRIFVYGVTEGQWYSTSQTVANNIAVTDAAWRLGDRADGGRPYDGLLDEVVVFNRVLRVGEVTAIQAGSFVWPYSPPPGNNDFTKDPDCVALWRLESTPLMGTDSIGTNDLTNTGVVADTVNFREGAGAGDWEKGDSTDVLSIPDAGLDPGFPFKSGDTDKKMSVCFWLQLESLPTGEEWLFAKVVTPNSFALCQSDWGGATRFYWRTWQLPAEGRQSPYLAPLTLLAAGQWYHVGATLDGTNATYRIRIYDLTNDEVAEISGTIPDSTYVSATEAPLRIGGYNENVLIDGRMDEIVVFNRILTPDEIDQIRGKTYGAGAAPAQATNPSPADTATGISITTDCSWDEGGGDYAATSYSVYFGTSEESLTLVSEGQEATSYDPGTLDYSTTYYWRVDAVNEYGTTTGDVWSFTAQIAPPAKATDPNPADDSADVAITTDLSWQDGGGAETYDVYFGTNPDALALVSNDQAATTYSPPADLDPGVTYYWRIDSTNSSGTTEGDTWTFTTLPLPGKPTNPAPADGSLSADVGTSLSWKSGSHTDTLDVWFGSLPSSLTKQSAAQAGTTWQPPATLDQYTTYYWRVDANNASGTTTGDIWTFRTSAVPAIPSSGRAVRLPKRLALPDPRNIRSFTDEERRFYSGVEEGTQKLLQILRDALTPGHNWHFDNTELSGNTSLAGSLGVAGDARIDGKVSFYDTLTYITRDGYGNMTLADAVVGSRTLKQLGCPTYKLLKATSQSPGDLHLSDANTWGVSKAAILSVRVVTTSTNWSLWLLQNDNGYAADDAAAPKLRIAREIDGNANLMLNHSYEDEDASNEVHLYYLDEAGAATADIYVIGFELI